MSVTPPSTVDEILATYEKRQVTSTQLGKSMVSLMWKGVKEVPMSDDLTRLYNEQNAAIEKSGLSATEVVGEKGAELLQSEGSISLSLVLENAKEPETEHSKAKSREELEKLSAEEQVAVLEAKQLSLAIMEAMQASLDAASAEASGCCGCSCTLQ